ncbi:bifunctional indole-3-glycerol phosphate synthase/phosphoribosylanthranilate isomerase, partial [Vibrio cholerae]|nr:bifunctional indole-3-glycerol phosphate synthase/phosphoribosylanthranilate isomerase [Vibrio cholerae]
VCQNHRAAQVADIASKLGLFAVQLHGEVDSAYVRELRAALPESIEIWKAYGVADALPELLPEHIDRHLLDAKVGEQSGGTGHSF